MDYELKMADNGKFGILTVKNEVTNNLVIRFTRDVLKFTQANNVSLFFYDYRRAPSAQTYADQYELIYHRLNSDQLDSIQKIAILVSPKDRSHDFIEFLCAGLGRNILIFNDLTAAKDWLAEKQIPAKRHSKNHIAEQFVMLLN